MNFQAKPRLLLQGDFALPNVDVLVLSTGQDPGMVIDAVVAAARLDWPVDKLRVLVIDETRSEVLKYQVEQYSSLRAVHVTYHQRSQYAKAPRGGVWPKSSTINLGLSETRAEGRIAGQYAVILEAEVSTYTIPQKPPSDPCPFSRFASQECYVRFYRIWFSILFFHWYNLLQPSTTFLRRFRRLSLPS
jgi:hypothetical protein